MNISLSRSRHTFKIQLKKQQLSLPSKICLDVDIGLIFSVKLLKPQRQHFILFLDHCTTLLSFPWTLRLNLP